MCQMFAGRKTAGSLFRNAVAAAGTGAVRKPLPILGTINAYAALLAEKAGAKAIYLSGSGVATASHGLPDLGITNLNDVAEDVRRITGLCGLPLLVDIDTGFGSAFGIARCIRELQRAGAAAVHIEDQVSDKRCGHRPGKQIVPKQEMVDRIKVRTNQPTNHALRSTHQPIDPSTPISPRPLSCFCIGFGD